MFDLQRQLILLFRVILKSPLSVLALKFEIKRPLIILFRDKYKSSIWIQKKIVYEYKSLFF